MGLDQSHPQHLEDVAALRKELGEAWTCKEMVEACGCWQHVLLGRLGIQPDNPFHIGLVA